METKEYIMLFCLIVLPLAINYAFSTGLLAESGYQSLLSSQYFGAVDANNIPLISSLLFAVSAVLIFLSSPEIDSRARFAAALLLILSPLAVGNSVLGNIFEHSVAVALASLTIFIYGRFSAPLHYLGLIFIIVGLFLVIANVGFILSNLPLVGMVLAGAALSITNKFDRNAFLLSVGLIISSFAPALAIPLIAFIASYGFGAFFDSKISIHGLVLAVFLGAISLSLSNSLPFQTAVFTALGFSILAYFLFSIYAGAELGKSAIAILLLLLSISIFSSFYYLTIMSANRISEENAGAFSFTKSLSGEVGILGNINSYKYYSGKSGRLLTAEDLISENALPVDYVILTSDGIYSLFDNSSIAFRPVSFDPVSRTALFANSQQILSVQLDNSLNPIGDAIIQDATTGRVRNVPFTKIRKFSQNILDPRNVVINTENLADSNLYNLLFEYGTLLDSNQSKVVKVQQ